MNCERFAPTAPPAVVVAHPANAASHTLIVIAVSMRKVDMVSPYESVWSFLLLIRRVDKKNIIPAEAGIQWRAGHAIHC
jgi:hypothetical protein